MRVPVKLIGFGFWLFFLNCARCQECLRENIIYENTEPVEKASYADGERVKLNCRTGYTGFYRLKCEKGEWKKSIERPCAKKQCSHPGDTPNGDFELKGGTEFVFGVTVVYKCNKGYEMASSINHRSCRTEGWDNAVPVCEVVKCPAIITDEEVTLSGNTTEGSYGDVIRFECVSSDKMINGSSEIHCEETGKWSDVVPKCKDITCTAPVIPNGYAVDSQPEYKKDAPLNYKCYKTFKPREGIPKCAEFGWTVKPECDEVNCVLKSTTYGVKMIIPHGKTIFGAREIVEITCSEKYWFFGTKETKETFTCKDNGEWDNEPVCAEITCDDPRDQLVYRPYFWRTMKLGEKQSYICVYGYSQTAAEATCTRDGWTPNPLCTEIVCAAPNIPNAQTVGFQRPNYRINSIIRYKCHPGFEPEELVQITCDREGQWRGIQQCTEICAAPNIPNAEIVRGQRPNYRISSRIQYKCHPGFEPEEPVEITCEPEGQWRGIQQCFKISKLCRESFLENGFIYIDPSNKEEIFYSCDPGYKPFSGNWWGSVTCRKGSQFEEARCIRKEECGALPSVHHGKLTLLDPETADVKCDPGFMSTNRSIKCTNGRWEKPVCKEIVCAAPNIPYAEIVGLQRPNYRINSRIPYKCIPGFEPEELVQITCDREGQWRGIQQCTEMCATPTIPNAEIKGPQRSYYRIYSRIQYDCHQGFEPEESVQITCDREGQWRGIKQCIEMCAAPNITNAEIVGRQRPNYRIYSRIQYKCHPGFEPEESVQITCDREGQWRGIQQCSS
ncbi:complement factor H isoform X6 [Carassius gibelio]|uniref:complement factor H isoform X6 n=1 Tax=Carassius gibelio TaxID=101364 RepID=UPI0022793AE3|nr:complement factor H isoform X6 [Carassius gibelio]